MKLIEFETELTGNTIIIPEDFQSELSLLKDKPVRVILLIGNNIEKDDETLYKTKVSNQFLNGYDNTDSVYDNL